MKRLTQIGCLILGLFFITYSSTFAQVEEDAQNNVDVGVGLAYGSEIESLGITADAYYVLNNKFRVGGGLTYFFPEELNAAADYNWFAIDLNGQYLFHTEEQLNFYGLTGLNIILATLSFDDDANQDGSTETYVGLNVGAGVEYSINFANLFGELKLAGLGGDADQLVLSAGLRFDI